MINPKISIIIPIYNVRQYVTECLESVIQQTYSGSIECLLVDDCGSDGSMAICEQMIACYNGSIKFRILHNEKNMGASAARNNGLRQMTGDYVCFLDADDYFYPNTLESLVGLIRKYPNVDLVVGNTQTENNNFCSLDDKVDFFVEYTEDVDWIRYQMLYWRVGVSPWNKLMRTSIIRDNSMSFLEGIMNEDLKWCFDQQKHIKSIAFTWDKTYWYRVSNGNSVTNETDKTHSVLSYLTLTEELVKGVTDNLEGQFACQFIAPVYKHRLLPFCKDRVRINKQIRMAIKNLWSYRNLPCAKMVLLELILYMMPVKMTQNRVATKLYLMLERKTSVSRDLYVIKKPSF